MGVRQNHAHIRIPKQVLEPDSNLPEKCEYCDRPAIKTNSHSEHVCRKHAFGVIQQLVKSQFIGRNQICPCGSGKKFKNCCIKK